MHTEKDFTNSIQKEEVNQTQISKIKTWFSLHRRNTRNKILSSSISLGTLLTFFPFILGLSQFLFNRIKSPLYTDSFFKKNLPLFANFQNKYNYETVHYILKSNISEKRKNKEIFLSQPPFITKIKEPFSQDKKSINGLSCSFYNLESRNSLANVIQNLDEIPSYLEGFKRFPQKEQKTTPVLLKKKKKKSSYKKIISERKTTNYKVNSGYSKKLHLINKLASENKYLFDSSLVSSNLAQNSFYKDRLEFFNLENVLDLENQKFLIETKIPSIFDDTVEKSPRVEEINSSIDNFLGEFPSLDEKLFLETLVKNLDKYEIPDEENRFRYMSGYQYPDMTNKELHWFYKQQSIFQKIFGKSFIGSTKPKTSTSPFLITTNKYFFDIKSLPRVLVETKKLSLKSSNENKVFYNGRALVLDSERNFDWKTYGEKNLRSWFHKYFSPLNPFINTQENYFGLYNSPRFSSEEKQKNLEEFNKRSLFKESFFPTYNRWDLVRNPLEGSIKPFTSSLQIPYNLEQNKLLPGLNLQIPNFDKTETTEQFLPVIQIQNPSFRTSSKTKFQGYSPFFDLGVTAKPDYKFSIHSLDDTNFITKYASGRYTKVASIFSKKSRLSGSGADNWEPLTANSWLVVSQLSFAVLIFHILKSLADNYGRELLSYLLDLVASLGFLDDSLKQEIEILMGQREKGFRVVLNSRKSFTDIVGVEKFLPELYEIVWFLRNSARDFALSKTLPRGVLLTGPPGTGKTLLVQALAGEAQVPVIVLSGSSLIEPGESGSVKLEMVFDEARQVAPCIVFIDEIDTLAPKRMGVVHNPMSDDDLIELLTDMDHPVRNVANIEEFQATEISEDKPQTHVHHNLQQLGLLTQLLIELDGIRGREGVIVIGATNRPDVLDPALLRPGRFDKILQVGLPQEEKRIEILKFYGQKLGYQSTIPWEYLAARTAGFTAADLSTLMNESAIKAILTNNIHTIETIEHGIDRLTTCENEKYTLLKLKVKNSLLTSTDSLETTAEEVKSKSLSINSKILLLRLAYYQVGKVLVSYFLEKHPKSVVASLWPRRPTMRSVQIETNLQKRLFQFTTVSEVNDRLVGCYAGKAAEYLFLEKFSSYRYCNNSTLGLDDLVFGQKLVYWFLEKAFFYSKKNLAQKNIRLHENLNEREFQRFPEKMDFYEEFLERIEEPPMKETIEAEMSSLKAGEEDVLEKFNAQIYYSVPWWQLETSNELEFTQKNFSNWSRIFLYNPERNYRNTEWFPPDEFYHKQSSLKNVKKAFANFVRVKQEKVEANKEVVETQEISENQEILQIQGILEEQEVSEKQQTVQNKETSQKEQISGTKETSEKEEASENENISENEEASENENPEERIYPPQSPYFTWNDISNLTRDYPAHSLILQSFNKALLILNDNRELLDRLAFELVYNEILRQPEIEILVKDFIGKYDLKDVTKTPEEKQTFEEVLEKSKGLRILEESWGFRSRKPVPRWIHFGEF